MQKHEVKKALVCLEVERHRRVLAHLKRALNEARSLPHETRLAVQAEVAWRKSQLNLLAYKRKAACALKARVLRR